MTRRIRLIILLVCAACFFIIAPLLVFYSMGDRFDFKKMKITETGGIYVRTFPAADQIIVDSKNQKTSTPGIWAAGDCTDGLYRQNSIAVGDGIKAIEDIYRFLKQ